VGGFLIDLFIVLAVFVAVGVTELVDLTLRWARGHPNEMRSYRLTPGRIRFAVIAVVVLAILPSVLVHHGPADHRTPPFTDTYARRVLAALPPNAVLVVGGYGYGLPLLYRQIVDGDRPDVTVIDSGTTTRSWYRGQLTRRFDLGDTMRPGPGYDPLLRLIKRWRESRPVYLDTTAMGYLRDAVGYRANGFVGEVVDGVRDHPGSNLDEIAAELARADAQDGVDSQTFHNAANGTMYLIHNRAHIELAKQFFAEHRLDAVDRELRAALRLYPADTATASVLPLLAKNDPQLGDLIRQL
jgi:hypothetical protein